MAEDCSDRPNWPFRTVADPRPATGAFATASFVQIVAVHTRLAMIPRARSATSLIKICGLTLALLLELSACSAHEPAKDGQSKRGEDGNNVLKVDSLVVPDGQLDRTVQGVGEFRAENIVAVKSRADGLVERVHFTEGAEVRHGDLLIEIDPTIYKIAVDDAEAQLARDTARSTATELAYHRAATLADRGFVSRETVEQKESDAKTDRAIIASDVAHVKLARVNLAYTQIRAPISGRIGRRLVDAGNIIRASDNQELAEISQGGDISSLFTLPQSSLEPLRRAAEQGQLTVEALDPDSGSVIATGRMTMIDNSVDLASGTFRIKAQFANAASRFWPGETLSARVVLARAHGPKIPTSAVLDTPQGPAVYVIDPSARARLRPIRIAIAAQDFSVVAAGLAVGETVTTSNVDSLVPGAKVSTNPSPAR